MARMIPKRISDSIKSNAEKRIFELFASDPATEDWIVLHSLGLSEHDTLIYGEVDFVVIAPRYGIFCLEVKGGRVARNDGVWYFTNRYNETTEKKRSPFEQAIEGMFSLQKALQKHFGQNDNISSLIFGYGVMFPDINFDVSSTEYEDWKVYDLHDVSYPVSRFIKRLSENTKQKWYDTYGFFKDTMFPDRKETVRIADYLRCDFERVVPLSQQIGVAERYLLKLTQEQLRCLDQFEDNKRCLVKGPAGTGKTLLAIEMAKRTSSDGERVGFFCFNNKLGDWLSAHCEGVNNSIKPLYIGTLHSYMIKIAKEYGIVHNANQEENQTFFAEELPDMVTSIVNKGIPLFDRIIVDEAQDLISHHYIQFMDAILMGGFSRGAWNFFGDFERQAIYKEGIEGTDILSILDEYSSYASFRITVNCRNTRNIGQEILLISSLKSKYLPTTVDGPKVEYRQYKDDNEQIEKLEKLLEILYENGIKGNQIIILSPKKMSMSAVGDIKPPKYKLREYCIEKQKNDVIRFSTIHGFKGLESPVVILVDINTYKRENLMYVALSRARTSLYIFESLKAKEERIELFRRSLNE